MKKPKEIESLCWWCERSDHFAHDGLYCSWAAWFIPVDGWTAFPTQIVSEETGEITESFRVDACPLFTQAQRNRKKGENGKRKGRKSEGL